MFHSFHKLFLLLGIKRHGVKPCLLRCIWLIHGTDLCVDVSITVYGILTSVPGINPAKDRIIYLARMTATVGTTISRRRGVRGIIGR